VIYDLNRLFEDIDLDNINGIDWSILENDLLTFYNSNIGYAEVTAKTQIGEWGIWPNTLKFPVLYVLGLIFHVNEPLSLEVEGSQHK
jgi:hypothetical protein